jgi:carbamoyltransferase
MSVNRSAAIGPRAPRTDETLESGELSVAPRDDDAVRYGIRATRPENIATVVAQSLSNGQIVGLYEARVGRGGTLADPRCLEAHALLEREGTRGFVPAVIAERAHQVFDAARTWTVGTVRPEWRERLGAALRLGSDVTVRPVSIDDAPRFHSILHAFASITELPVVLERSFDTDGGPRVTSAEDALRRFLASRIDSLVLDGVLFEKCPQLHQPIGRARSSWPPADPRRTRLAG